jgi:predicted dehydrogenase
MIERPDVNSSGHMNRRDFLAAGALPLAAVGAAGAPQSAATGLSRARQSARLPIRLGIIGAGANVRNVMVPNLRRIPEYELVAVANTSLASSQRVATEFDIPRPYANWKQLLEDDEIDAILIGTWPYMHHTLTLASLERGKHVLCQARMANTAQEAREMLEASLRYPELVCQLVPTSTSYSIDNVLKRLLAEGAVGEILSVDIRRGGRGGSNFARYGGEMDWRHTPAFVGYNIIQLGSVYESSMRWFGPGNRVMAMAKTHIPYRRTPDGELVASTLPDHVDIMYELSNNAQVHMRFSEASALADGNHIWIFGSEGTIHVEDWRNVYAGQAGDSALSPVPNPPEQQATYRVEEEFINAILGREPVRMNTFGIGVKYMEWTEAVHRSAQTGQAVYLPV